MPVNGTETEVCWRILRFSLTKGHEEGMVPLLALRLLCDHMMLRIAGTISRPQRDKKPVCRGWLIEKTGRTWVFKEVAKLVLSYLLC